MAAPHEHCHVLVGRRPQPFTKGAERVRSARSFQTSTCYAMARASSTSIPRYLTVLSILLPAGNRIDYLPCRTMSRRGQLS